MYGRFSLSTWYTTLSSHLAIAVLATKVASIREDSVHERVEMIKAEQKMAFCLTKAWLEINSAIGGLSS